MIIIYAPKFNAYHRRTPAAKYFKNAAKALPTQRHARRRSLHFQANEGVASFSAVAREARGDDGE